MGIITTIKKERIKRQMTLPFHFIMALKRSPSPSKRQSPLRRVSLIQKTKAIKLSAAESEESRIKHDVGVNKMMEETRGIPPSSFTNLDFFY